MIIIRVGIWIAGLATAALLFTACASYHPVLICSQVGPNMIVCMDVEQYKVETAK